jgi:hypothetical protein
MKQLVTVHRVADRHADLHEREFAETRIATVEAGDLGDVLAAALIDLEMDGAEPGKFIISTDWPHE